MQSSPWFVKSGESFNMVIAVKNISKCQPVPAGQNYQKRPTSRENNWLLFWGSTQWWNCENLLWYKRKKSLLQKVSLTRRCILSFRLFPFLCLLFLSFSFLKHEIQLQKFALHLSLMRLDLVIEQNHPFADDHWSLSSPFLPFPLTQL